MVVVVVVGALVRKLILRWMAWLWDMERYSDEGLEGLRAQRSTTWKPWVFVIFRVWVFGRRRAVPVLAGRVWGVGVDIVRGARGGGWRMEGGKGDGWAIYAGGLGEVDLIP